MSDSTCKSCGAPIKWAITDKGKPMPVDPEPRADGNITLTVGHDREGKDFLRAHYLQKGEQASDDSRHVSHFVTCPNAAGHRR